MHRHRRTSVTYAGRDCKWPLEYKGALQCALSLLSRRQCHRYEAFQACRYPNRYERAKESFMITVQPSQDARNIGCVSLQTSLVIVEGHFNAILTPAIPVVLSRQIHRSKCCKLRFCFVLRERIEFVD